MPRYSHLFFDLDRTLWDLDANVFETLGELYSGFKLNERGVDSVQKLWDSYHIHNNALWASWEKGLIDRDKLRNERFVNILNSFNIPDKQLALDIAESFLKISPTKTKLIDGAESMLQDFHENGYKMAIITNGFEDVQHTKIKCSGLGRFFPEVITSERAGYQKPLPEIFEFALKLTDGKTESSIMIGDSLSADMVGARNAGIDHVYFNYYKEDHDSAVTYEITSLTELEPIVSGKI